LIITTQEITMSKRRCIFLTFPGDFEAGVFGLNGKSQVAYLQLEQLVQNHPVIQQR